LELLEQLLADFDGTVLLVSHDRDFLDNAATSTLVFEGEGRVVEYVGGYSDWLRQRPAAEPARRDSASPAPAPAASAGEVRKSGKLSYKLQRELEALPGRIEALEARLQALNETVAAPDFYRQEQP